MDKKPCKCCGQSRVQSQLTKFIDQEGYICMWCLRDAFESLVKETVEGEASVFSCGNYSKETKEASRVVAVESLDAMISRLECAKSAIKSL